MNWASENAIRIYAVAFALLGGVLPLLFLWLPLHFDEAIFLVLGDQWAEGTVLYTGVADHKPPAIFALAALGDAFVDHPHVLMRLLTYLTVAATALLVAFLGRRLATRPVGMVASICYLGATYVPHFDGYFFLTEPYSNFCIVLAAVLLFEDRRALDALAGAALGVGVLFNQTVFLFGLAFVVFRALLLRDPANRTRGYLVETTTRFLTIGAGFLVPVGLTAAYFYAHGLLTELFYYAFYLPLTSYSPPFDLYGHLVAGLSLAPLWLLAFAVVAQEGYRLVKGRTEHEGVLFVACWLLFISYPGATSFVGDHKLLFTFPAVGLLAAIGLHRVYRATRGGDAGLVDRLSSRRNTTGSVSIVAVIVAGFLLISAASVGFDAYYASNRLDQTVGEQEASADRVAASIEGGQTFTYPVPQAMLYYHNDSLRPVDTFATIYDESTRERIISDVEEQRPEYLVVRENHVAPDGHIYDDKDLYFTEHKAVLVGYLNENYEPVDETESWVVYRRV